MANPFPQIPFQTQLDFLWSELQGPEKKTLEAFQSGGYVTPQDYAEAFEKLFERSKGSALDKRKQYALEVFRGMEDPLNPQGLSQNAAIAYNYLLNKGLNAPQAAGIVGNLMAESFGSLDPAAYNPSGGGQGALGIAQWRGPRLESLLKFAGMNGEKPMVQSTFGSGVPTAGTIFPQQQQQRQGGLRGLLSSFMQPNEITGLTGPENFAQALDALILPEARMGEQIRARGAQRLQSQSRNKTIETLKQRAAQGDKLAAMVLQGLQSGAYDAKTAMSLYMGKMLETPKKPSQIQLYEYAKTTLGMDEAEARKWAKSGGDTIVDLGGGDAKKFNELDAQMLSEIGQAGLDAGSSLKRIDRLENLLMNVETGATATVKSIAGRYGIATEGLDNIQAAEALINSLVPQQRPAGSGTMSDADLLLFKRSLPSLINTPEGNKLIIQTMRGIAEYDRMGFEIIQKYRRGDIDVAEAFQLLNERPDPTAWLTENPNFSTNTETQTQTIQLPNGPTITFEE